MRVVFANVPASAAAHALTDLRCMLLNADHTNLVANPPANTPASMHAIVRELTTTRKKARGGGHATQPARPGLSCGRAGQGTRGATSPVTTRASYAGAVVRRGLLTTGILWAGSGAPRAAAGGTLLRAAATVLGNTRSRVAHSPR